MSRRALLYLNVAIAAVATAGIVIGLTLDTRTTPRQHKPFAEKPPVPTGLPAPYGPRIVAAFRSWPDGSIDAMQRLGLEFQGEGCRSKLVEPSPCAGAIVHYYRGIALLFAGYPGDAQTALEMAKRFGRNTVIQGKADVLLHPAFFQPPSGPSYPVFVPIRKNPLLVEGARLQEAGHQVSAAAVYAKAAEAAPDDDEAQVAAAVALFDEDNLTPAFSHLGPLVKRFPKSQVVRYYLGLLLAWTAQSEEAVKQFKKTVELGPTTELGKSAIGFLEGLTKPAAG